MDEEKVSKKKFISQNVLSRIEEEKSSNMSSIREDEKIK